MKLRQIAATNIKGRTFSIPLAPANVLIGTNMSGKTAVLDAIRLALGCPITNVQNTNAGIFQLASANAMRVEVTLDDGTQIERAWMAKADGSITKNERRSHGIGEVPLVMLDANEYLGKSERERLEMIFGLMNLTDTPMELRVEQIEKRLDLAHNKRTLKALAEAGQLAGENFQRWLERVIEFIAQEKRNEDAVAKKMNATTQSLAHIQLEDDTESQTPESIAEELQNARTLLESKRKAHADTEAQIKAHSTNAQRRMSLVQRNEKLRTDALSVGAIEGQIAEQRQALGALALESEPELSVFWDKVAEADGRRIAEEIALKHAQEAITEADAERDEVLSHANCPTCSANRPTWKKKAQAKFETKLANLEGARDQHAANLKNATTESTAAKQAAKQAEQRREKADAIESVIQELEKKLERCRTAAAQITQNDEELELIAKSSGSPAAEEARQNAAAHADAEYNDALDAVKELENKQQQIANALADRKQLQTAAQKRDEAKGNVEELKSGLKIIEEIRNNFMTSGFAPLLAVANHFATGVLPTPLEYRGGDIGRMEKNRWISWRTFSGAETDITRAAISAALGAASAVRIVVVDELGRMDTISKTRFIRNILAALPQDKEHTGLIDQFLGADVDASVYEEINAEATASQQAKPLQILPIAA